MMILWFKKLKIPILLEIKNICLHCFYIQIINKYKNFKYVSISKLIKKEHKKNLQIVI